MRNQREVGTHFDRHMMMSSSCAFVGSQVRVRETGSPSSLLLGLRNHLRLELQCDVKYYILRIVGI